MYHHHPPIKKKKRLNTALKISNPTTVQEMAMLNTLLIDSRGWEGCLINKTVKNVTC